jgi:glycerol-3-phosphate dehydrogenase
MRRRQRGPHPSAAEQLWAPGRGELSDAPAYGRAPSLAALGARPWDVVVIGGGIVGAGVLREVARCGLRCLLVEQNDFASGTSSRSSKLIHGGLQYLARLELGMAWEAVRAREAMLRSEASLVERLGFVLPVLDGGLSARAWQYSALLTGYAALAGRLRVSRPLPVPEPERGGPHLRAGATRAFHYDDARTDDARLVLHVLRDGFRLGGTAVSYTRARTLLRDPSGRVVGAALEDRASGGTANVLARVVVNATGPWSDRLRAQLGEPPAIRRVRGSHLVLPRGRLPIPHAVAALLPSTGQHFFCIPWEGVTLVGTTAVEDTGSLDREPVIAPEEAFALLEGVNALFPALSLSPADVQATFAGLRAVVDRGSGAPAAGSRQAGIREEAGLVTVVGGKLTTFHTTARKVIDHLLPRFPGLRAPAEPPTVLSPDPAVPAGLPLAGPAALRLVGRYGLEGIEAIASMSSQDRQPMAPGAPLWGELRWAAQAEGVRHLDDLLLRRLRVGLTLPDGASGYLAGIRSVVQRELGWEDARWADEEARYRQLWRAAHGMPELHGRPPEALPFAAGRPDRYVRQGG